MKINKNGILYMGTMYKPGTPIRVYFEGEFPVYSSTRANGTAYVGRKWAGRLVRKVEVEEV